MKIVVLAGGLSDERDVSLTSGSLVANALTKNGHDVILVDIYKGIENIKDIDILFKEKKKYKYNTSEKIPNLKIIKENNNNQENLIGKNIIEVCKKADIVFLALHGSIGENGKIQALFDLYNIKYTGSGYKGSMLAMDKEISKRLFKEDNIKTADYYIYGDNKSISFPLVIKPCNNGSSIGVSIANNNKEFDLALNKLKNCKDKILVEKYIKGREFSVGIIENNVLPPIEIIPSKGFYDYKNKYQKGYTKEICPANISEKLEKKLKKLALKVHKSLYLENYSRIDFILKDDDFYCLEANTLPGMTPISLLPTEALKSGINYAELCDKLIEISLKNFL